MARPSKNYTKREKKEGRTWTCILYDSPDIELKLNRLQYFWDNFYYIKHDKDVWTEEDIDRWVIDHEGEDCPYQAGEPKKVHYHCIGYSSPCVLGRAATKFDVPSNMVQHVKSKKAAIRYLIHLDHPAKHQYSPEEIVTNDLDVEEYLKNEISATKKAKLLIEYIYSVERVTFYSLSMYAIENELWDELRRGQHLYSQLLAEHNKEVLKNEN